MHLCVDLAPEMGPLDAQEQKPVQGRTQGVRTYVRRAHPTPLNDVEPD
jgi:hypothetical protein